jgi:hypothetical protein
MRNLIRTLTSAVFIFGALGFVLARYGTAAHKSTPVALDHSATAAYFSVDYPSNWTRASTRDVPRVPLTGSVALIPTATGNAELVIGTASGVDPENASSLPTGLSSALPDAKPQIVTLGGASFYRFLNLSPPGQAVSESIYTLPTTIGTITAVCSDGTQSVSFTSSCERVLATIKMTNGKVLSLTADAGYALAVNRILGQLNSARTAEAGGLRSSSASARERAATRVAAADDQAANAAHHITQTIVSLANISLEAALRLNATGYRALARATSRNSQTGYVAAQSEVSQSQTALNGVYAQLRGYGYKIG